VFGVDVGTAQAHARIRADPRVVVMEQTNLRHLRPEDLPSAVDLVTLDLSFISVLKVLPAVCGVLRPGGRLVVLVKPQFEAGRDKVGAGGVVRDVAVRQEVVARVVAGVEAHGLGCVGVMESPLKGDKAGNTEFLALFKHEPGQGPLLVAPLAPEQPQGGGG
jgi:23S rRNA (cytidine1920-2'-O)/16S rRNA (cytidine1409-2'-O)-methyltransferase